MTRLEISAVATDADREAVRSLLAAANAEAGWPHAQEVVLLALRDGSGAISGGLIARYNWRWLCIETLAVAPALPGAGWGARLRAQAEREARACACIGVRLDTHSFRARGVSEKQGYALSGEIADCPPGHARHTMTKRLDAAAPTAEPWPDAAAPRATLNVTHAEWESASAVIGGGLPAHNPPFGGDHGFRPLNIVVRRPGGLRAAGGLTGFRLYRWLYVKEFLLPDDLRGGGLGGALPARAEGEAAALSCIGVWLDTFSFQARPFYERLGYRVFGTIEDFPPGHSRHYLMKRLGQAPRVNGDA